MRHRVNFNEVALFGQKSGKCACGKYRSRRQKFWQTLNPFNTRDDGKVKSRDVIREELRADIKVWEQQPIRCSQCPTA